MSRKLLTRNDLHAYQNKAVDFIISKRRSMLILDMGLGKTASTLTAISDLIDGCAVNKVLVIAPLRVANSVWKQEAEKWEHLKHLEIRVCTGAVKKRREALHNSADVYVINREQITWLVNLYGDKWPFDCVVVDESSSFKNQASKSFKSLRRALPYIRYITLLTGTPTPNGLGDIWSQCYLVDYGMALGRTVTSFRNRFFDKDFFGHSYKIKKGADKKIHELIKPFSLSMSAEDYLELPECIVLNEVVELPTKVISQYKEFERELFIELGDGEEVEAANAAVLANKLLQYSSGAVYTDDKGNYSVTHDAKLAALKELLDDEPGNVLVAYNFKSDLDRLKEMLPDAVVLDKNPETIAAWNRGDIKVMLAHPASAGHGLNLQDGGSMIVWFTLTWSLELYQQFNARLHRQGQTLPVRIVHLIANDTIDSRVMGVLSDKDASQAELLNALKLKN